MRPMKKSAFFTSTRCPQDHRPTWAGGVTARLRREQDQRVGGAGAPQEVCRALRCLPAGSQPAPLPPCPPCDTGVAPAFACVHPALRHAPLFPVAGKEDRQGVRAADLQSSLMVQLRPPPPSVQETPRLLPHAPTQLTPLSPCSSLCEQGLLRRIAP